MANRVDDLLRDNLRNERERRKLTQTQVAEMLLTRVRSMHTSTVAKIEAGTRAVHADELSAYADIFGVSVDALLGRTRDGTDLAWAVAKLTSSAQKTASEVHALTRPHQRRPGRRRLLRSGQHCRRQCDGDDR